MVGDVVVVVDDVVVVVGCVVVVVTSWCARGRRRRGGGRRGNCRRRGAAGRDHGMDALAAAIARVAGARVAIVGARCAGRRGAAPGALVTGVGAGRAAGAGVAPRHAGAGAAVLDPVAEEAVVARRIGCRAVDHAVAVVVHAVAELGRSGMNGRIMIVAIGRRGEAVTVRVVLEHHVNPVVGDWYVSSGIGRQGRTGRPRSGRPRRRGRKCSGALSTAAVAKASGVAA